MLKEIIEDLQEQIESEKDAGRSLDSASWTMEEGVLLTVQEAEEVIEKLAKIEKENEELHEQLSQKLVDQTFITNIATRNGGLDMTVEGGILKVLADNFAGIIMESGAENYLEVSFSSEKFLPDELLTLTLQRCKGKTPHQFRAEHETKLAKIREAVKRCRASFNRVHEDAENYDGFERMALLNMAREIEGILEMPF